MFKFCYHKTIKNKAANTTLNWKWSNSYVGGQGFLGQHIIRQLQQDDKVAEIRILDKEIFTNRIG